MRAITLQKGDQRFVFRFGTGSEVEMLEEFAALASDENSPIDWFDAAQLSFQIAHKQAARCLKTMEPAPRKTL